MADNVSIMAKKKTTKPAADATRYPSRDKIKYAGIPRAYWDLLEGMSTDGGAFDKRSVSFLTTLAVRNFLFANGKVDEKGKPIEEGK